jgi:elongation factor G
VFQLITTHRGQILGYENRDGWKGWDKISAYMAQAEMQNLIVELRSLTMGVGYFRWQFDHLQEVPDKLAERVLSTLAEESNGNGNGKS